MHEVLFSGDVILRTNKFSQRNAILSFNFLVSRELISDALRLKALLICTFH